MNTSALTREVILDVIPLCDIYNAGRVINGLLDILPKLDCLEVFLVMRNVVIILVVCNVDIALRSKIVDAIISVTNKSSSRVYVL